MNKQRMERKHKMNNEELGFFVYMQEAEQQENEKVHNENETDLDREQTTTNENYRNK